MAGKFGSQTFGLTAYLAEQMNASNVAGSEYKKQFSSQKGFRNELSVKDKTNIIFSFYRTVEDLSARSLAKSAPVCGH